MFRTALVTAMLVAAAAAQAEPDYSRILDAETFSFENGETDRAVLVANGDSSSDLYIYLDLQSASDGKAPKPALVKKDAAWDGGIWGSRPSLETSAKGSLLIKSENSGAGRDRWSQTLTVVYRNRQFIVAGLTREAYDTLAPESGHSCDLNFLSGKGKKDGKAIDVKTPAMKLADWSDGDLPKECNF
ncbi:MAG: hypothetical protein ACR652_22140 [Methylocystis sp.]|uniref:hypothetical protein n=1 Tax=Methylocystis sp. TaxID=1911079 RepID=UPI003DA1E35A